MWDEQMGAALDSRCSYILTRNFLRTPLRIEKSFRMSKHDLQARPIYHHIRESIEAHLSIVFAALTVSHWVQRQTGWSIKKFVRTARRYRTVRIKAGAQILTAADPLPDDLRDALIKIRAGGVHI
jgi:hypothetical protein